MREPDDTVRTAGYPRPTIVECEQLHAILTKLHGERVQVPYQPGEHPDLLDSMVRGCSFLDTV
jgi:hypothetical protein